MVTLVIAVVGVTLSALSLGWQAATFVLTGGRVKAELRTGATDGRTHVTIPAADAGKEGEPPAIQAKGFNQVVIAVQVRNVGRLPVWVTDLSVGARGSWLTSAGGWLGVPLPHRLEAGAMQTWAVDAAPVRALVAALSRKVAIEKLTVRAKVGLGTGHAVETAGSLSGAAVHGPLATEC